MSNEPQVIRVKGRNTKVPTLQVEDRAIITTGRWLKMATVRDEAHLPGENIKNPEAAIAQLKAWGAKPDIFCFAQKQGDPEPRHPYYFEWNDFAAIPITTYENWQKNQIKKDVKENLRRAKREGIVVRSSPYDDEFVRGIKSLCDETPLRQGKPFWHYGKTFEEIKEVHGTYQERAEYIGAYFENDFAGFIKMVYTDNYAKSMHVISKERYHNKRPTNALIAKAVEICAEKGVAYFIYGEFNFTGKKKSSLTEFKRHNGFQEMKYPRYYVPLTLKGRIALKLGLHLELRRLIPEPVIKFLLGLRAKFYSKTGPAPILPKEEPPQAPGQPLVQNGSQAVSP